MGIKNLFNSDYNYHKLVVNVDDRIRINPIGYFDYILEYGKIWNQLPYPLLELASARIGSELCNTGDCPKLCVNTFPK